MEALRVLIADDHPLFRKGMRALLTATPGTEVVGEATTGQEVIELAAALQPDVILMDLQMPGINGIEATRQILHTSPPERREGGGVAASDPGGGQRGGHLQPGHRHAIDGLFRGSTACRTQRDLPYAHGAGTRDIANDRPGQDEQRHCEGINIE